MNVRKKTERILKAFFYSMSGLQFAFRDEAAFREIIFLSFLGIPLALIIAKSYIDAILLILPFFICIIVELVNTAIENICDLVSSEYNEFIKKAKDMGSAAQFVSQIYLIASWAIYLVMNYY